METMELAVIGGGVVGISTALHLQRRGVKVTVIDRGEPDKATSYGNSGIIEASYVLPFSLPAASRFPKIALNLDPAVHFHYRHLPYCLPWIMDFYAKSQSEERQVNGRLLRPLVAEAIDEHIQLMQGTDAAKHMVKTGRVKLHRSEESFNAAALERRVAEAIGVPFEVLSASAFCEQEPALRPFFTKAVKWTSSVRLTDPGAVIEAYRQRFLRDGGAITTGEVDHLSLQNSIWRIVMNGTTLNADQVVVCTGPWTNDLLPSLGYEFPLGIKRGYHMHYASQNGEKLAHALVDADIGYLICPMEKGIRLTTGAEFADLHAPATPVQLAQILPYARELFPIGEPVEAATWLGSRPCFADSLPVIDRAPRHPKLWFNFGHGHSGLTIGPASGRLMAEMIRGEKTFCDPAAYRATRF